METNLAPRPLRGPLTFRAARTSELTLLRRMAPEAEAFDRGLIAAGRIRVLASGGLPVGAVGWIESGAGRVALRLFFVFETERGQGYGRHLLDAALAEVRGAGHRWIDADAPAAAVPFLVRCGFSAVGPAPFFIDGRPLTGVWMSRAVAARVALAIV